MVVAIMVELKRNFKIQLVPFTHDLWTTGTGEAGGLTLLISTSGTADPSTADSSIFPATSSQTSTASSAFTPKLKRKD